MLKTKIAIVTGATSGIGEATAKELAQNGTKVVLVGRNFEKAEKIAKEIDGFFIKCDVSNENDVKNMINETIGKLGKIDILFNNAGVMLPSMEIERMPVEDWEKSININLQDVFWF